MPEKVEVQAPKSKKKRSPAYPGINLAQAIKKTSEFYEAEHRNPASFVAAAKHWGYGPKSGGALVAVAALKSFGLLTEIESAKDRTFQVSPLGLQIVADKRPESKERDDAIKQAALRPKIHADLWRRYNGLLPSDTELAYRLETELDFNPNSISGFIKELKDTIAFAKLVESDNVPLVTDGEGEEEKPADTGEVEDNRPLNRGEKPKNAVRSKGANMKQDVFSLSEGEAVLSWPTPLSAESIADLKDWLKIMERKIARSVGVAESPESQQE